MFKHTVSLFLFFMAFSFHAISQSIGTGEWRLHLPYGNTVGVAETPRYIYSWAQYGFFRYDKEVGGSEQLSKIHGFSDIAVSTMKYNAAKDLLIIAYQDANLDLVRGGQIVNMNDIQRSTSVNGLKTVNNIFFNGDFAYLACPFGIVLLDVERLEIKDNYLNLSIGDINDVAVWNGKLYAATTNGLYSASVDSNLHDPLIWKLFDTGPAKAIQVFDNKLFTIRDSTLKYYDGSWKTIGAKGVYNSVYANNSNLYFARADSLVTVDKSLNVSSRFINILKTAIVSADGSISYTTNSAGTLILVPNGGLKFISPPGPYSTRMGQMASLNDEVIVAGGTIGGNFAFTFTLNGFYRFVDEKWINSIQTSNPALDTLRDFYAVITDHKTGDVWLGAYWQGLVQLRNGQVINVYNPRNSKLKLNIINYLAGMAVDKNGHLWLSNYGSDSALVVKTNKGEWASITLGNIGNLSQIVVDDKNRKWIVAPRNSGFGLIVYDDNNTPLNANDDLGPKQISINEGQGKLPDNQVNCIARDRDGEIWVGTLKGPAVFSNPSNIFSSKPSDAHQIVIGEGTDIGYLLGNEVINCIYVDGGNRKWMGTNNGAWLVSADGQQILQHFSMDNSPLFSNGISQITANEKTGEVFFATDRGIISYKGDATVAKETHGDVLVYPNPVREDFDGVISIRGLAQDANVKITDIAGNLIYETRANGGMATWNGRSFSGRKASTGVYLIFSGTDDASDTYVTKVLVINGGN